MFEVVVGNHDVDIAGEPVARGSGHTRDLAQLVAESFVRLLVDPALQDPEADSRRDHKNQRDGADKFC